MKGHFLASVGKSARVTYLFDHTIEPSVRNILDGLILTHILWTWRQVYSSESSCTPGWQAPQELKMVHRFSAVQKENGLWVRHCGKGWNTKSTPAEASIVLLAVCRRFELPTYVFSRFLFAYTTDVFRSVLILKQRAVTTSTSFKRLTLRPHFFNKLDYEPPRGSFSRKWKKNKIDPYISEK